MGRIPADQPDLTQKRQAVELVQRFKMEAEKSEKRREAMNWWKEADNYVEGRHWDGIEAYLEEWMNRVTINRTYAYHEMQVALQVDELPQIEVVPRMPHQDDFAQECDSFITHEWDTHGWNAVFASAFMKLACHGMAFIKTYWDAHADQGRGAVKFEPVSMYDLLINDGAVVRGGKLIRKFLIHHFKMSRQEVLSQYGVDPGGEYQRIMSGGMQQPQQQYPNQGLNTSQLQRANELHVGESYVPGGGDMMGTERSDQAAPRKDDYDIYECHYNDDTRVETPDLEKIGSRLPPLQYPNGRIITVCDGYLLRDMPNPLRGIDCWVPLTDAIDLDTIYRKSFVNHLASPQKALNKRASQMADHNELVSNPVMVFDQSAMQTQDFLPSNKPGTRIPVQQVAGGNFGVSWLEPPSMSQEVTQEYTMHVENMEFISGLHEGVRGDEPVQRTSGVALDKQAERGQTRTKLKNIFSDEGIKQCIRNALSMYIDFVPDNRAFRFVDPSSMMHQWGNFNPQERVRPTRELAIMPLKQLIVQIQAQLMGAAQYGAVTPEMTQAAQMQMTEIQIQITAIEHLPAHDLVSFDVIVQVGTRHHTKAARASMAIQLKEMDAISNVTLMQWLEVPGWQKAHQLKQEENQALAEATMEAEQREHLRQVELKEVEFQHDWKLNEQEHKHNLEIEKIKLQAAEAKAKEAAANKPSSSKPKK